MSRPLPRIAATVAGLLLCLTAGAAHADALSTFRTFCLETDGKAAAFAAAVKARSWFAAPDDINRQFDSDGEPTELFSDIDLTRDGATRFDLVGLSAPTEATLQGGVMIETSLCMVATTYSSLTLDIELSKLIGPGITNGEGQRTWIYSRDGGKLVEETSLYGAPRESMDAFWGKRTFYMLILTSKPGVDGAGLITVAIRKPGT